VHEVIRKMVTKSHIREVRTQNGHHAEQNTLWRMETTQHWLTEEVNLFKHNSGLNFVPEFNGANWEEFKRPNLPLWVPNYARSWQV